MSPSSSGAPLYSATLCCIIADPPRRGRPADPRTDDALRRATAELLAEVGWRGVTVDAVAERAGVARTTVYRRHGSLHGVLLLMLGDVYARVPVADTGSVRGDLVALMRDVVLVWRDPARVDLLRALVAAQGESDELAAAYRASLRARRVDTRRIVARAVARGELAPGTDGELLLDLLSGIVAQRVLLAGQRLPLPFAEKVVDAVLGGFGVTRS